MSSGLRARQNGFSLFEVLIALLIFSVGALGLAVVQIQAQRNLYEALHQSLTSYLAGDILARIHSNPGQLPLYLDIASGGEGSEPPADCISFSCTPAQLAARDFYDWRRLLNGEAERVDQEGERFSRSGLLSPHYCFSEAGGEMSLAISWRGMTAQSNPGRSKCGESFDHYGEGNRYRRLLLVTSYIPSP